MSQVETRATSEAPRGSHVDPFTEQPTTRAEQRRKMTMFAVALALVAAYPLIHPAADRALGAQTMLPMMEIALFVILALGLNIVVGFAGLLDLGYVAFFAIGAYTVGWFGSGFVSGANHSKGIHVLVTIFGVPDGNGDVLAIAVTVPLLMVMTTFISRSRLGKAMRATAQDREAAALMGINIDLTISLTFLLGGALAGASGLIYGLYFTDVHYQIGFRNGLIAFTAAVLGGIGNVRGAALGGFMIGLVASVSDLGFAAIFPALRKTPVLSALAGLDQKWTLVIVFGLLIVTLVFRPTGLLGEEVVEKA